MASRYKILKDQVEPKEGGGFRPQHVPKEKHLIRASMVGPESLFNWMAHTAEVIKIESCVVTEMDVLTVYSGQYPKGYELVRAEFDIINPKGDWEQNVLRQRIVPGDKGHELDGKYDNEFKIIYPETLDVLKSLNVEALKEHLQTYYHEEFEEALGLPDPEKCPKGGKHEWGIDELLGVHGNDYCKKCYVSKRGIKKC